MIPSTPGGSPTPTLVDDLERAAAVIEAALVADVVRHGGKISRDFPDRLRAAAERLKSEMENANREACESQTEEVRQHFAVEYCVLRRINGGVPR